MDGHERSSEVASQLPTALVDLQRTARDVIADTAEAKIGAGAARTKSDRSLAGARPVGVHRQNSRLTI